MIKFYALFLFISFPVFLFAQDTTLVNPLRTYAGHAQDISAIAYSFDGKLLATGAWDRKIIVWNTDSTNQLFELSGHNAAIVSLDFSRNNRLLLSTSVDGAAILWDINRKAPIRTIYTMNEQIRSGTISPDTAGRLIALAVSDGTVRVYDGEKKYQEVRKIQLEGGVLPNAIAFDNTGRNIVVGCNDNSIRFYNPLSGQLGRSFEGHRGAVNAVAFSNDGRYVISGSNDRTAIIWNVRTGAPQATLSEHNWNVQAVAFNARGNYAVTGSNDGTARLWDVETGTLIRTFRPEARDNFLAVTFSPDSRSVITTSRVRNVTDAGIKVWETGIEIKPAQKTPPTPGARPQPGRVQQQPTR